jgi:hypothetical protein
VPRSLHKKLVDLAARENVSLNQLVTSLLAESVGTRHAIGAVEKKAQCDWRDIVHFAPSNWRLERSPLKAGTVATFLRLSSEHLPSRASVTEYEYGEETRRHCAVVRGVPADA